MPPEAITNWLKTHYPKPTVDPEWLRQCYDWIIEEKHFNPATDMQKIIDEVEIQLLESDLRDSMLHGTGIPINIANTQTALSKLTGPTLVQVEAITDVGISAYSLNKTRMIREERIEAGEEQEGEADGEVEGEGPIPNYGRSMLRMEISDGATTITAAEYRHIPELTLGSTPLGYKFLIQNAEVRRGIVFLEPRNITLKGHMVSDLEQNQGIEFARGLRRRLGLPEPDSTIDPVPRNDPGENQVPRQNPAPNAVRDMRSPLRDIPRPLSPTLIGSVHPHSDDEDQPRRRRIPNNTSGNPTSSVNVASSPFNGSQGVSSSRSAREVQGAFRLSPTRQTRQPTVIESDDEDEAVRPIKALPTRPRASTGSSSTSSTRRPPPSLPVGKAGDESDDEFGFDPMSDSLLEAAAQIELANSIKSMSTGVQDTSTRDSSRAEPPSRSTSSRVITIEDEEEDDKENVVVPTRHVRQRTAGRPMTQNLGVLDLTDSD